MRHDQDAFDRNTEAFKQLMAALDRFEAHFETINQRAQSTDDLVAELETWCAASRVRRRELLEKVNRLQPPAEAA